MTTKACSCYVGVDGAVREYCSVHGTSPFPKSRSQIRRLIAQSEDKMFKDAKPSTKAERKSFDAIAKKLKTHYQFCVDNDDSCICEQARDGDKLYVAVPVFTERERNSYIQGPAPPAPLTVDEGVNALADCMGIASVTYGDAGMKWIKGELRAILKAVSYCSRCGFLDD